MWYIYNPVCQARAQNPYIHCRKIINSQCIIITLTIVNCWQLYGDVREKKNNKVNRFKFKFNYIRLFVVNYRRAILQFLHQWTVKVNWRRDHKLKYNYLSQINGWPNNFILTFYVIIKSVFVERLSITNDIYFYTRCGLAFGNLTWTIKN